MFAGGGLTRKYSFEKEKKINFPPDEKFLDKTRGRPSRSLNSILSASSTFLSIPNFRNDVRYRSRPAFPEKISDNPEF